MLLRATTLTCLRHSKADKTSSPNHRVHTLSAEGRNLATLRRLKLGEPAFDIAMTSILPRTQETSQLVAGSDLVPTTIINGLFYDEGDPRGTALDLAFDKLGYSPLRAYIDEVGPHLASLASQSYGEIVEEVARSGAFNALLVGHAVLLPMFGCIMTGQEEPFMSRIYGECEGFRIEFGPNGQINSIEQIAD